MRQPAVPAEGPSRRESFLHSSRPIPRSSPSPPRTQAPPRPSLLGLDSRVPGRRGSQAPWRRAHRCGDHEKGRKERGGGTASIPPPSTTRRRPRRQHQGQAGPSTPGGAVQRGGGKKIEREGARGSRRGGMPSLALAGTTHSAVQLPDLPLPLHPPPPPCVAPPPLFLPLPLHSPHHHPCQGRHPPPLPSGSGQVEAPATCPVTSMVHLEGLFIHLPACIRMGSDLWCRSDKRDFQQVRIWVRCG